MIFLKLIKKQGNIRSDLVGFDRFLVGVSFQNLGVEMNLHKRRVENYSLQDMPIIFTDL